MKDLAQAMREIQVELLPMHPGIGVSSVFLHQNGVHGRETLLERLNDTDRFLPLKGADGRVRLHSKSAIAALVCREELEELRELRELLPSPIRVRLRLRDGSDLEGELLLLLPGSHQRALDFLNASERFFLLATPRGATFVNQDWIDFAMPSAETP